MAAAGMTTMHVVKSDEYMARIKFQLMHEQTQIAEA